MIPSIEQQGNAILLWRFEDAPSELQELSTNGGDEDWVVLFPLNEYYNDQPWISWMHTTSFGEYTSNDHMLNDGRRCVISSHA